MIENTVENKSVFFARYWGQNVGVMHRPFNEPCVDVIDEITFTWVEHLILNPLSMITDEDCLKSMMLKYPYLLFKYLEKGKIIPEHLNRDQIFFLISKGYYVGDGTEVEYKWCVLKTDK